MALSNNERQVRYRARSKVLASAATASVPLIDRIANEWVETRNGLAQQLELMETGIMRTGTNNVDDTAQTIARVRRYIAEFDDLIEKATAEIPPFYWRIERCQAGPSLFTACQYPFMGAHAPVGSRENMVAWLTVRGLVQSASNADIWVEKADAQRP